MKLVINEVSAFLKQYLIKGCGRMRYVAMSLAQFSTRGFCHRDVILTQTADISRYLRNLVHGNPERFFIYYIHYAIFLVNIIQIQYISVIPGHFGSARIVPKKRLSQL